MVPKTSKPDPKPAGLEALLQSGRGLEALRQLRKTSTIRNALKTAEASGRVKQPPASAESPASTGQIKQPTTTPAETSTSAAAGQKRKRGSGIVGPVIHFDYSSDSDSESDGEGDGGQRLPVSEMRTIATRLFAQRKAKGTMPGLPTAEAGYYSDGSDSIATINSDEDYIDGGDDSDTNSLHKDESSTNTRTCTNCFIQNTRYWYRGPEGKTICGACYTFRKRHGVARPLEFERARKAGVHWSVLARTQSSPTLHFPSPALRPRKLARLDSNKVQEDTNSNIPSRIRVIAQAANDLIGDVDAGQGDDSETSLAQALLSLKETAARLENCSLQTSVLQPRQDEPNTEVAQQDPPSRVIREPSVLTGEDDDGDCIIVGAVEVQHSPEAPHIPANPTKPSLPTALPSIQIPPPECSTHEYINYPQNMPSFVSSAPPPSQAISPQQSASQFTPALPYPQATPPQQQQTTRHTYPSSQPVTLPSFQEMIVSLDLSYKPSVNSGRSTLSTLPSRPRLHPPPLSRQLPPIPQQNQRPGSHVQTPLAFPNQRQHYPPEPFVTLPPLQEVLTSLDEFQNRALTSLYSVQGARSVQDS
ncbi:hypothetical protein F5Y10DRAFT_288083 [Nemania abortiva]|nr:hypothetical protein F5Y10DRAFT_288083 [Nemania abortiva]